MAIADTQSGRRLRARLAAEPGTRHFEPVESKLNHAVCVTTTHIVRAHTPGVCNLPTNEVHMSTEMDCRLDGISDRIDLLEARAELERRADAALKTFD